MRHCSGAFFIRGDGMTSKEFHRERLRLEFSIVLRFFLLCIPLSVFTAVAWWVFSVEDSPTFLRVGFALPCVVSWYALVRHFFASMAAWETLDLLIWHWSNNEDVSRLLRLGIPSRDDNRVQVVQPERVIPIKSAGSVLRTMSGFDVADLSYFVVRSFDVGTGERSWIGHIGFPSKMVIQDVHEWRALLKVFGDVGLLVDVGIQRKSARWIVHDPKSVLDAMNLPLTTALSSISVDVPAVL